MAEKRESGTIPGLSHSLFLNRATSGVTVVFDVGILDVTSALVSLRTFDEISIGFLLEGALLGLLENHLTVGEDVSPAHTRDAVRDLVAELGANLIQCDRRVFDNVMKDSDDLRQASMVLDGVHDREGVENVWDSALIELTRVSTSRERDSLRDEDAQIPIRTPDSVGSLQMDLHVSSHLTHTGFTDFGSASPTFDLECGILHVSVYHFRPRFGYILYYCK